MFSFPLLLIDWLTDLGWATILLGISYILSAIVAVLIISENRNPSKTLGYLLLLFVLPYLGVLIYFVFGENYRKRKLYKRKLIRDERTMEQYNAYLVRLTREALAAYQEEIAHNAPLVRMLLRESRVTLTVYNEVKLLVNGEEKFPAVMAALKAARHHIHLEYYIFEESAVAEEICAILKQKAREGVKVRLIYDDFGSSLSGKFLRSLHEAGVEALPFYKIYIPVLSNRHNYRNHRKIIIVDGETGFVGGINISDRYDNSRPGNELFWRDTHLMIKGDAVKMMQALFLVNWNFCADEELGVTQEFFPDTCVVSEELTQIVYSGPDSDRATVMLSYFAAISNAQESICITTPYFIPNESILNALKKAAFSGVEVKLIVPGVSDSRVVNAAARSYYEELLEAGVQIYLYQKGFVHAKTMVCDGRLCMVGSSNMDIRSFDLNFEVNAVLYSRKLGAELVSVFEEDLRSCEQIFLQNWKARPRRVKLADSICRLFSPLL